MGQNQTMNIGELHTIYLNENDATTSNSVSKFYESRCQIWKRTSVLQRLPFYAKLPSTYVAYKSRETYRSKSSKERRSARIVSGKDWLSSRPCLYLVEKLLNIGVNFNFSCFLNVFKECLQFFCAANFSLANFFS